MSSTNAQGQHVVTAVIVAHDGAAWLPRIAEALLGQTRPVQRVVAVDTGSRDRSGAVLTELLGRSVVFGMDRRTGYGHAVSQALRHRAANTNVPRPAGLSQGERVEWVWLLHDDCEPAPDALEQLLRGAAEARTAAVLGPKVMDWSDRRVLLEAGVTIDTAGRRITGIEPREVDQGQHDGDRDVLAVTSAGMLVRRDVWDQASGFDPGMPLFRDDVDFCWRVHAAGHRVRVVTDAVVYHLEAAARNRRSPSAAPRPRRADRHNALFTLLANLPLAPAAAALAGNLVLSTLRTLFFLLAKRPHAALDELAAVGSVLAQPFRLLAARRRRARGRRAAYSRLRSELPRGRSLRRLAEFAASVFYTSTQIDTAGSHHATDDPDDDEDYLLVDSGLAQRILTNPGVLLFAGLTTIALVAERSLLTAGTLAGGALSPAWGGVSPLWQEYLQGFHPAGIGSATSTPPYVAFIAALATLLGGKPWLAIDVIMIGCIPLAGLAAFFAARRITTSVVARVWAGAAYALLPVGMGAVAAGRFGSAVVFTLLPVIAMVAARIFTAPGRRARRAAWACGLLIAIAAAFVPLTWVAAVAAAILAAVTIGRGRRRTLLNLVIAVAVPPVLLLPWTVQVATRPALLFLEAGNKVPGLATADLAARSLLLLSPGGPGLPPFWVTGGIALAALAALLLTARRSLVLAGWSVALLGLVIAVGVSRILVTPAGAARPIAAWPGISLALAAAGLVLAAVVAADVLPAQLGDGHWRQPRGLGILLLTVVAASAPLLAAASWVTGGVRGPIGRSAGPVLPAFVSVSSDTGLRLRTLVLRASGPGGVSYEVLRGADPLLGTADLTQPPSAQQALDSTVSTLVAPHGGDAQDQGQALAALGIGYVLLPAPVDATLASGLDNVAALRPVSTTTSFQLWRVADTAARVRVIGPGGTVAAVPSGPVAVSGAAAPHGGGTLVLAEPAGGWSASLNGTPLQPLASPAGGWAQAFRLPAGGGTLDISHSQLSRDLIVAFELLALLVVIGLGLPGARLPGESAAAAAAPADPASRGERARARTAAARGAGGGDEGAAAPGRRRLSRRAAAAPATAGAGPRPSGASPPSGPPGSRRSVAGGARRLARRERADLAAEPLSRGRGEAAGQGGEDGRPAGSDAGTAPPAAAQPPASQPSAAGPPAAQRPAAQRGERRRWRRGAQPAAESAAPAWAEASPRSWADPAGPPAGRPPGEAAPAAGYPAGQYAGTGRQYPAGPDPADDYLGGDYPGGAYPGGDHRGGDYPRGEAPGGGYPENRRPAGRHVSRGRLPGDDDALPAPSRRGPVPPEASRGRPYPDAGGHPSPGGYPGEPGYRDGQGYPAAGSSSATGDQLAPLPPQRPAGPGAGSGGGYPPAEGYPEPGAVPDVGAYPRRADYGAAGYPGSSYPGTGRRDAEYPGAASPGADGPRADDPGAGYPGPGYPGTERRGKPPRPADDPDDEGVPVAWGSDHGDEPRDDW
ncbi:MAG TPA: glycosyltransferase [Streptosporangiaceae bacterium]|nr:glycosyltransferase [Streptosporangiaceae bacterium]